MVVKGESFLLSVNYDFNELWFYGKTVL